MNVEECYQLLVELADLEVEATSIADSRRILTEIEEREDMLRDIHLSLKREIRHLEADYLRRRRELNLEYKEKKQSSGIMKMIGRGTSRVDAMKKLDKEKEEVLGSYKELKLMTEDLLVEMENAKGPLENFVIDRLGL